jgi:uncharacterized protein YndB with AHSA1/START domain
MASSTAIHNTFVIERTYNKPISAVFAAFQDPRKKRKWYADGGSHDVEAFESDFRVGGAERSRYRFKEGTPFPGVIVENQGTHKEIVKDGRIVIESSMTLGGKCISVVLVTFEFQPNGNGTKLVLTHQGVFFEGADGPQMREMGWKALLDRLSNTLEN